MQEAQASLRSTLAFLATPDGTPPLWNDPRAADDANRTRDALHARGRVRRMALSDTHWVMRNDEAQLRAQYATGGRRGEQGRLALQLVRREGRWLVAGVRLEPTG